MSERLRGKVCAVTGAGGYLGGKLSEALELSGAKVHRLSGSRRAGTVPFSLTGGAPAGFFSDAKVDVLVHCAWDFTLTREKDIFETNVDGSLALMRQADSEGVHRIVFISTISAFGGCRSLYGKAKLAVERQSRMLGAIVVRPGLVYGEKSGAIVGAITRSVEKLPVVPLIGNGRQVLYPAHDDDLARLICELAGAAGERVDGPIVAASEQGRTFRELVQALAVQRGRPARMLPLPWRGIWALLKVAELGGLKLGFRSDSVVSLMSQDPQPSFDALRATGVVFRTFTSGPASVDRQGARPSQPGG